MVRPASLFALIFRAALVFAAVPAAAQQAGGEALDPEVLSTPGAAELIRERAFARLQSFQAIRGNGISGFGIAGGSPAAAANPNAANPALDRSAINQQALARIPSRGDAGFLAGFSGGQALAPSRIRPPVGNVVAPTFIDESKTVVVNAFGSPVSIGKGNIVQQQVANSTAISVGGPASATAAADNTAGRGKPAGAGVTQSATSSATGLGAPAGSAGGSGNVAGRGAPR
jgi:hypothetical protein